MSTQPPEPTPEETRKKREEIFALLTPLTRDVMDEGTCKCGKCSQEDEPAIQQRCHPHAGLTARYIRKDGIIVIRCLECGGPMAKVRVAQSLIEL